MTTSRLLTSAIAAATIVGAVGFVYAQSTDSNAAPPATSSDMNAAPASPQSTAPAPDSSTQSAPPAASSSDATMPATEPAPKADRN